MDPVEQYIAACVESASAGDEGQRARQWLQELGASPGPYQLCIAVINRVALTNRNHRSSVVFQCLSTILHALEREWAALAAADIHWLETQVSSLMVAPWVDGVVLNQSAYCWSVIQKRLWSVSQESDRASYLLDTVHRFLSDSNLQAVGLALAQHVISEFSSQHGSALNLTWESHLTRHRSFERLPLLPLFQLATHFLRSQPVSTLTGKALNVVVSGLSWSFEESISSDKLALRCVMSTPASDATQIALKPGPLWRRTLLHEQPGVVDLLTHVHSSLVESAALPDRKSVSRLARQALIHLASLQGNVFPAGDDVCAAHFVQSLCASVLQILSRLSSAMDGEMVLDSCVMVQRIITCHGMNRVYESGAGIAFFDTLANLTLELIPSAASSSTSLDTWISESLDLLLDCWSVCVSQSLDARLDVRTYTDAIFQRYFRVQIDAARASATDDDDEQFFRDESRITFNDEQFVCVALLARVAAPSALGLLSNALDTLTRSPLTDERHECVCITVVLLVNVLSDASVPGEVNIIPDLIVKAPASATIRAVSALVNLVHVTVQQIRSESIRDHLSPFAVQTLISALQSFTSTYVTFDSLAYAKLRIDVAPDLAAFLLGSIPEVLDLVLQLVHAVVFVWESEFVASALCGSLLLDLTSSAQLRQSLLHSPSWTCLVAAFDSAIRSAPPCSLPSSVLRRLCQGISKVVVATAAVDLYWVVLQSHIQRLCLGTEPNSSDVALDLLNGVAKCSGRLCVDRTFPFILSAMASLVHRCTTTDMLELCVTLALGHLPLLDQPQSDAFFAYCMEVIQSFSASGLGALGSGDYDVLDSCYRDVDNLLTLLHHCTAKDLFDFGPDAVTNGSDAAFAGLCALLPLFSPSALFQFPAISISLYDLLSSLLVSSPDQVMQMSPGSQAALVAAIQFSLHGSVQASVQIAGVNALKAIVDYAAARDPKLRRQRIHISLQRGSLSPSFAESLISFQRRILALLLYEPISDPVFEPLVDCLRPIIQMDPVAFERLTSSFIDECADDDTRARLRSGFHLLLEGRRDATEQERRGRFFFRHNCIAFVQQCRPFLQRK